MSTFLVAFFTFSRYAFATEPPRQKVPPAAASSSISPDALTWKDLHKPGETLVQATVEATIHRGPAKNETVVARVERFVLNGVQADGGSWVGFRLWIVGGHYETGALVWQVRIANVWLCMNAGPSNTLHTSFLDSELAERIALHIGSGKPVTIGYGYPECHNY